MFCDSVDAPSPAEDKQDRACRARHPGLVPLGNGGSKRARRKLDLGLQGWGLGARQPPGWCRTYIAVRNGRQAQRDTAPEVTREKFYRQVRESSQFEHIAPGLCLSPLKCPFWVPCCCSPPVLLCVRCLLIFRGPLQGALNHVQGRLQHCPPLRELGSRQEFVLFPECLPCAGPCPGG